MISTGLFLNFNKKIETVTIELKRLRYKQKASPLIKTFLTPNSTLSVSTLIKSKQLDILHLFNKSLFTNSNKPVLTSLLFNSKG